MKLALGILGFTALICICVAMLAVTCMGLTMLARALGA